MPRGNFRVEGADQLASLSLALKTSGNAQMQKRLRAQMRAAMKPAVADVKRAATPVSRNVARSITPVLSYTQRTAGAKIVAKRSKMPAGKESLPALLELGSQGSSGQYIRHQTFGHEPWVRQPTRPFFYAALKRALPAVERQLITVLDDIAKELRRP